MTEETERSELTEDQVIFLFERQVNYAILWVFLSGFACVIAGFVLLYTFRENWYGWVMLGASVLAGGMVQRMLVLRVRCPNCGVRALGRIHSVMQARNVRTCPGCGAKLRD